MYEAGDEVLLERVVTTRLHVAIVREVIQDGSQVWLLCDIPGCVSVYWPAGLTRPATLLREVLVPARIDHQGIYTVRVKLKWVCPVCGKPRGEPRPVRHWNGKHVIECQFWTNPCGHEEDFQTVRQEAFANGLNAHLVEGVSIYEHDE